MTYTDETCWDDENETEYSKLLDEMEKIVNDKKYPKIYDIKKIKKWLSYYK